MSFEKPLDSRHVELYVDEVDYKKEIPEDVFSTLTLMKMHVEKRSSRRSSKASFSPEAVGCRHPHRTPS